MALHLMLICIVNWVCNSYTAETHLAQHQTSECTWGGYCIICHTTQTAKEINHHMRLHSLLLIHDELQMCSGCGNILNVVLPQPAGTLDTFKELHKKYGVKRSVHNYFNNK